MILTPYSRTAYLPIFFLHLQKASLGVPSDPLPFHGAAFVRSLQYFPHHDSPPWDLQRMKDRRNHLLRLLPHSPTTRKSLRQFLSQQVCSQIRKSLPLHFHFRGPSPVAMERLQSHLTFSNQYASSVVRSRSYLIRLLPWQWQENSPIPFETQEVRRFCAVQSLSMPEVLCMRFRVQRIGPFGSPCLHVGHFRASM